MSVLNRRELLRRLLAGLVQASGAAVFVLASAGTNAGVVPAEGEEAPLPEVDPNQEQPLGDLQQRVERLAANQLEHAPRGVGEEDSWINSGFRNNAFANGGFANGGGGFSNASFRNVPGGGGFRNTAVGGGGVNFRNGGGFRNW